MKMWRTCLFIPAVALVSLTFSACESPSGTGALYGAAAGAAVGGIAGGTGRSAAIGAAGGAAAGALVGHLIGHSQNGYYQQQRLPYARRVGRGLVESPYYPHNVVDVRDIPSGAVVEDPYTGRYFIRP